MDKVKAILASHLSRRGEPRFILVNEETGEIVDDAQGHGYTSAPKAHAAYAYLHRDKSKDKERKAKEKAIRAWFKANHDFKGLLDGMMWDNIKCNDGPIRAKDVKEALKRMGLECEFTAGELLRVYQKRS